VTRIVRLSSGSDRSAVSRFTESTKINSTAGENDDPRCIPLCAYRNSPFQPTLTYAYQPKALVTSRGRHYRHSCEDRLERSTNGRGSVPALRKKCRVWIDGTSLCAFHVHQFSYWAIQRVMFILLNLTLYLGIYVWLCCVSGKCLRVVLAGKSTSKAMIIEPFQRTWGIWSSVTKSRKWRVTVRSRHSVTAINHVSTWAIVRFQSESAYRRQ
jgi:hypothetical protein